MKEGNKTISKERYDLILQIRDVVSGYTDQERDTALRLLSNADDNQVPEKIRVALIQFINIVGNTANQ